MKPKLSFAEAFKVTPRPDQLCGVTDDELQRSADHPPALPLPRLEDPRGLATPSAALELLQQAVQPSPTVDDFSAFIDMQRLASQLEPGAPEGGGAALDVSQLDWLKAQSDPLLLRGAAVPLNKPLPDISASVGLGGHTLRATVVRTSSRGKTSIQLRFEDGPVPAKKKATLPQLLGMVGEIGPKLSSAQRQSLWADHDPFASADAQAAFLSAILEKRFDDGTARQQAAADTQRADGKTHKAGVYVATLNEALATRHGLPRHYVGLFCRKALMLGRNGWVELPIEVLFSQRRDEHLQAAERTLQEISFQVALHRFGADSFDWRIVLKDGDVPVSHTALLDAPAAQGDGELARPEDLRPWAGQQERARESSPRIPPLSSLAFARSHHIGDRRGCGRPLPRDLEPHERRRGQRRGVRLVRHLARVGGGLLVAACALELLHGQARAAPGRRRFRRRQGGLAVARRSQQWPFRQGLPRPHPRPDRARVRVGRARGGRQQVHAEPRGAHPRAQAGAPPQPRHT